MQRCEELQTTFAENNQVQGMEIGTGCEELQTTFAENNQVQGIEIGTGYRNRYRV